MNPDSSETLLQKLCELQQQQLSKLAELSTHLSEIATQARKNHDDHKLQTDAYEQYIRTYREREESRSKDVLRRGYITIIMLGLIAAAIIVSRFL